ncbi:HGxxPAAW family protein [Streptomyces sp. DG2A-72]|uniref:HGxxPAAW family protein n=1 Tax=Streptomyces sp. DG2A-72 TaxID=3051386 RepID=UPI00265BDA69|nr:HGxxPAAW family protein [Streptomyces sp. DG2A-72]MDO0934508.1 HGxxPAAW family protein [Streptomyces sp. DG2A-72]
MSAQYDEGHTVAGWTGFGVASVGAVVVGVGVCMVSAALLVVGLGVGVVSVLVTWVLHLAGWGKPPGRRPREQWGMRVRDPAAREGHAGCLGCRLAGRGRRTAEVATSVAVVGQREPEAAAAAESLG